MLPLNSIIEGDCLEVMKEIDDKSIDMILCDLPYGTTACSWDKIIPFEPLWAQYKRIIKDNGAIVLTASQPFTSALVMSNPKMFKYALVWDKKFSGSFSLAKKQPMKTHEDIMVFGNGTVNYYPQMVKRDKTITSGKRVNPNTQGGKEYIAPKKVYDKKYPISILSYPRELGRTTHPTQKPVALFEYLIKTYTNEGDLVLDNCAGSGTTGVAAKNLKRNFILIEKEPKYVEIARERIKNMPQKLL